jgi:uncharacterized protein
MGCRTALLFIGCLLLAGCQWFQDPSDRGDRAEAGEGNRQLVSAIRQDDPSEVRRLIEAGAEVNLKDRVHTRPIPIVVAARRGKPEVMKVLIDAGADVNVRDAMGATPLMHAAWEGHEEVVRMLLQSGADVNAQSAEGVTALEAAKERDQKQVVEILLQAGAQDTGPPESLGGVVH